jgi:hypothetical protein
MIRKLTIFLALFIFLSGCRQENSLILQDSVCEPPCWHGITPGTSSLREILTQLSTMPGVEKVTRANSQTPEEIDRISWNFNPDIAECGGYAFLSDNLVSVIEIDTCDSITLDEAVTKFGDPDKVSAIASQRELRWLSISLLYPQKGVAVVSTEKGLWPPNSPGRVTQEQHVKYVYYFDPRLYEDLLRSDSFLRVGACEIEILSSMQSWHGFGDIAFVDLSQSEIYCP